MAAAAAPAGALMERVCLHSTMCLLPGNQCIHGQSPDPSLTSKGMTAPVVGFPSQFPSWVPGPSIVKFYHALVEDSPSLQPRGAIEHGLHPVSSASGFAVSSSSGDEEAGQPARTLYRTLARSPKEAALLELQPLTGARHLPCLALPAASVSQEVLSGTMTTRRQGCHEASQPVPGAAGQ